MTKIQIIALFRRAKRIVAMPVEPDLDNRSVETLAKVADAARRSPGEDIDQAWARFEERKQALRDIADHKHGPRL